jgi:membrane-bound serine protease (ClpP class)
MKVENGIELERLGAVMRKRIGWVRAVTWLALFLALVSGAGAQETRTVDVLKIEGPVTPIMISYIERGIRTAENDRAEMLVIELNTPGGQIDLMSEIVQVMLEAGVPVTVYVYPAGGYAASAGTLITLAAHVSAMAPGTTIGAASPVGQQGEDLGETMETKAKEDLKA